MGALLLSDSERAALRTRASKSVHPLFKLLAVLFCSILFLALVVWTGDRKSNKLDAAVAPVIEKQAVETSAASGAIVPATPSQQ